MSAIYERSMLEAIEGHELFGEHDRAKTLINEYQLRRDRQSRNGDRKVIKNQVVEGTLVAAGWDRSDNVNQLSLYTNDDEDILLDENLLIKDYSSFLNHRVKIWGDVVSNKREEKKIAVKKIRRLSSDTTLVSNEKFLNYEFCQWK
jgi:hypothetical protein